ncbi:MAG: hypothetical protein QM747_03240 [Nocardioides sp.]
MVKKPRNVAWIGFTREQSELLDFLDHLGNNGWARNPQSDALMTKVLAKCEAVGLTIDRVKIAMGSIGYSARSLHMLDRWECKRTTGRFGR